MTDVDTSPQFGSELRDAFKPVNAWVSNGIAWLEEVQQFYRERSAIEKEYAAKLTGLCRKYHERKAKKSSSLSVGDTPSLTPGSLESASLTTWTTQLSAIEAEAADRDRFGSDLLFQVAEPLKQAAVRFEELRRNHVDYAGKLEKERDSTYSDLKKVKGKYDGACQEVENRRKKTESSFDHGKQKAQVAYQQQTLEMNNVKNTYLISINVANKLKEKYYYEYVPELLNGLQDLNETRVSKLNSIWMLAAQLEKNTLTKCDQHVSHLISEIPRNEPRLDSTMFIRHNMTNWQDPADMQFEPSPVWHDDATMITDETSKVFLRNTLVKSKAQAEELKAEADKKRKEVENAKKLRQNIRDGKDKRDEAEVVRAIFAMQEDLHLLDRKRLTAEVETSTIISVVGDLSFGAKNHNFRSQTFKIPTNCDLCGERIWGLSAKGFDCRDCGYTCHSKCEMKVPAECPGEQTKEEKKKLKIERQETASSRASVDISSPTNGASELPTLSRRDTMNSLSSGYAASAARSVSVLSTQQVAEEGPTELPASAPSTTTKPATAPRRNRIVAPPPAQYISAPPPPADQGEADGGRGGGGGRSRGLSVKSNEARGKMMYPYDANGEDEITVEEGREVIIVEPDDGSGWMRVRAGSRSGLVPASYVEAIVTPSPALSPKPGLPDRPGSTYSNSSASLASSVAGKRRGPAVAPKRGAKKLQYVVALYDYEARSDAEWSMAEGDRFVLVNRDSGNGWSDVEKGGQTKSVPANYIEEV
ncbi:actin polymerization protein Bzz1 [Histoplasma capsulatum var. duboisii H88]|uniref:High osmolarity signaling protein SHO1 n=1 Tax=Ajellomyces capsulatus (strain H88) TaxID=544711 RepID=A0A8A1LDF5_AJEC8|nr:actin polymerization protein Bzz1 [Histoplasma capsulatum var. duboisii H88]